MSSAACSQDLDIWLKTVVKWQTDNSMESFCEQLKALDTLVGFLHELSNQLHKLKNVKQAVESMPNTGQLLGRLCSLPMILGNKKCYQVVMKCVMFYWTQSPINILEKKAKAWALSQIRNMVCQTGGCFSESSCELTPSPFYQQCLDQIESMMTSFRKQSTRHWESQLGCMVSVTRSPTEIDDLVNVCRLCLHLRHLEEFSLLLDQMVMKIESCADTKSQAIQRLLSEMSDIQQHPYSGQVTSSPLPYHAQLFLWHNHWPSLELEILDFVEVVLSTENLQKLETCIMLQKRHLPKACAENPELLAGIDELLDTVQQRIADPRLDLVEEWLHSCVKQCIQLSDCETKLQLGDMETKPRSTEMCTNSQNEFIQAVRDVSSLRQPPTREEFAVLYGLFKQATAGNCIGDRPEGDPIAEAQYDAWYQMRGTERKEAAVKYIQEATIARDKYGLRT